MRRALGDGKHGHWDNHAENVIRRLYPVHHHGSTRPLYDGRQLVGLGSLHLDFWRSVDRRGRYAAYSDQHISAAGTSSNGAYRKLLSWAFSRYSLVSFLGAKDAADIRITAF